MEQCKQYKSKIEDILKTSDLSSITTKSVRRDLERQLGISLSLVKKEVNQLIEELFMDFQEAEKPVVKEKIAEAPVVKKTIKQESGNKVTKKKATVKVVPKEEKKKRVVNAQVLKILPPLSDIIGTEVCTRFRTVSKIWEYIRKNNLQVPTDKRKINCDENLKKLTGLSQVTAFSINKYTQKYFVPIPEDEQPKYKQIFKEQEESSSHSSN